MLFPSLSSLWTFTHTSRPHSLSGSPSELQVLGAEQSGPGRLVDAIASGVSRRPSPSLAHLNGSPLGAGGFAAHYAVTPPAPLQRVSISSSALNAIAGASSPGAAAASPTSLWCRSKSQTSLSQSPANLINGKARTPRPLSARAGDDANGALDRSRTCCDGISRFLPSACSRLVRRVWLDVCAACCRPGAGLSSLRQRMAALILLLVASVAWLVLMQGMRLSSDGSFLPRVWWEYDVIGDTDPLLKGMTYQHEVKHTAVHACGIALQQAHARVVALCPVDASHTACVLAQAAFPHIVVLPISTLERRVEELQRALFGIRVVVIDTDNLLPRRPLQLLLRGTTWTAIRSVEEHTFATVPGVADVLSTHAVGYAAALADGSMQHTLSCNCTHFGVVVRVPEAHSFHLLSSRAGDSPHVALLLTRPPTDDSPWVRIVDAITATGVAVRLLVPPASRMVGFDVPARFRPLLMPLYDDSSPAHSFVQSIPAWQVSRRVMHFDSLLCLHDCDPSFAAAADTALAAGLPTLFVSQDAPAMTSLPPFPLSHTDASLVHTLREWLVMQRAAPAAAIAERVALLLRQRPAVGNMLRMASDALQAHTQARVAQLLHVQAEPAAVAHNLLADTRAETVWTTGCERMQERTAKRARANDSSVAVAYYTYELSPINSGGAGVVIAALAIEMISRGNTAIVIGHMDCNEVDAWARHVIRYLGGDESLRSRFHVHCVWHLVSMDEIKEVMPDVRKTSEFIRNSAAAAFAMQRTYMLYEYDAVEVFDYNGVGMDILRARADSISPVATLTLSRSHPYMPTRRAPRSILAKAAALWFRPHMSYLWLPLQVPVIIRAHGTIQAIDESETTLADRADRRACYSMEQYAAEAADIIFAQSHVIQHLYQRVYNLAAASFVFAPPPMARILDMFTRGADVEDDDCAYDVDSIPVPCNTAQDGPESCIIILVLGKLQHVKGPETVAAAFASLVHMLPPSQLAAVRLVFVGHDLPCPVHRRPMSECVHGLLPPEHVHRVFMTRGVSRMCIPRVVRHLAPTFAIMASEFETFNLVAHELAFLRVPLIVSDIPAYREFFHARNAYVFAAANATSLAVQMATVVDAATRNETLRVARLEYQDPVQPYHDVVARAARRCAVPTRDAWPVTLNHTATFGVPSLGVRHALEQSLMRVDSHYLCPVQHP